MRFTVPEFPSLTMNDGRRIPPLGNDRSFEKEPITAAAARTGKSPAQVILRWHVQLGQAVISRSVKPARQAENLDVFDFDLSEAEMAAIATLDVGLRTGPDPLEAV